MVGESIISARRMSEIIRGKDGSSDTEAIMMMMKGKPVIGKSKQECEVWNARPQHPFQTPNSRVLNPDRGEGRGLVKKAWKGANHHSRSSNPKNNPVPQLPGSAPPACTLDPKP